MFTTLSQMQHLSWPRVGKFSFEGKQRGISRLRHVFWHSVIGKTLTCNKRDKHNESLVLS